MKIGSAAETMQLVEDSLSFRLANLGAPHRPCFRELYRCHELFH